LTLRWNWNNGTVTGGNLELGNENENNTTKRRENER